MSSHKHPPDMKEGTRKAKNFFLIMLFVLRRKISLSMSLARMDPMFIPNQFLAKGNGFTGP